MPGEELSQPSQIMPTRNTNNHTRQETNILRPLTFIKHVFSIGNGSKRVVKVEIDEESAGVRLLGTKLKGRRIARKVAISQKDRCMADKPCKRSPVAVLVPRLLGQDLASVGCPFRCTAEAAEVAAYCVRVIWPNLLADTEAAKAWFSMFCRHSMVHHAFHFACAVHSDLLHDQVSKSGSQQVIAHKTAAIGLLKRNLMHLDRSDTLDAAVLTVLALASNELDPLRLHSLAQLPFEPHMPTASWVSVYGRLETVKTHSNALSLLVDSVGGLPNLTLPGLANMITFSDLLDASAQLRKPAFPCTWQLHDSVLCSYSVLGPLARHTPGHGFFTKVPVGMPASMSVLVRLATVDRYMSERRGKLWDEDEAYQVISSRNAAQHALLSLPDLTDFGPRDVHGTQVLMYGICRLTAVIYSNAVILGLPPHSGWHTALVKRLRRLLEVCRISNPDEASDLLVWSVCVGGLAALGSPHRCFFETFLKDIVRTRKLLMWRDVQIILEDFIWSDAACRDGAGTMWLAVMRLAVR
ncbi:hypothetical protein LTR56_006843 [Elasticomyces elasticus]|nr:hypothetical protein LTR56_006843 [Elasticomyces elasticus]KAK3659529.1 hypothetical protein LTR22_008446 [Elasticomyces elasticus]KAK4923257.1 hypothetical protein LTR49_009520 [Elasticomyces elasticus]